MLWTCLFLAVQTTRNEPSVAVGLQMCSTQIETTNPVFLSECSYAAKAPFSYRQSCIFDNIKLIKKTCYCLTHPGERRIKVHLILREIVTAKYFVVSIHVDLVMLFRTYFIKYFICEKKTPKAKWKPFPHSFIQWMVIEHLLCVRVDTSMISLSQNLRNDKDKKGNKMLL